MLKLEESEVTDFYIAEIERLLRLQVDNHTGDILPGCIEVWDCGGFQSGWLGVSIVKFIRGLINAGKNYPSMMRKAFFCNVPAFAVDLVEMSKSLLPNEQAEVSKPKAHPLI